MIDFLSTNLGAFLALGALLVGFGARMNARLSVIEARQADFIRYMTLILDRMVGGSSRVSKGGGGPSGPSGD